MSEVEDEVKKLCEKRMSPIEAWDRVATANIARFAMAKRHTVSCRFRRSRPLIPR